MTATTIEGVRARRTDFRPVPLEREVRVELRKMFDTRSGFWLVASIAIAGLVATVATIMFAPDEELTYYTFAKAIGFPITVLLPMVALLSITGEWSQRSGLTTFTLVPNRRRVVLAKTISSLVVAIGSMVFAFVVGALGTVVGSAVAGVSTEWDVSVGHALTIVLGNLICLMVGTMLGMLIRSSPGALVVYFVYTLVVPTIAGLLAASQPSFVDLQPWVDLNFAQTFLFEGDMDGAAWAHLGAAASIWLLLPGVVGFRKVMRSEVK